MTKHIITQEDLSSKLHYNPDTGIFTWLIRSACRVNIGDVAGSHTPDGYIVIRLNGKYFKAHRLAWIYINGSQPDFIDHINSIKSDNRIINLRNVNNSENQQNKKKSHSNNHSGLLGVSWNRNLNKWHARISINKNNIHIGFFDDKHEAHKAYLERKRIVHTHCEI